MADDKDGKKQEALQKSMEAISGKSSDELKAMEKEDPKAYAQLQRDAFKSAFADTIKKDIDKAAKDGGSATILGTNITAEQLKTTASDPDYEKKRLKIASTQTQNLGDDAERAAR